MGLFNNACRGNFPGRGGRGLTDDTNRLYFGGGGGAGHANNGTDSRGGNGGGLMVLWAPNISFAENTQLDASGEDGPDIIGDGGGGGGAGGTILLLADTLSGRPEVLLNGGQGADVTNGNGGSTNRCFGPGGGGGGGRLITAAFVRAGYQPSISVNRGGFGRRFNSTECSPNEEAAGPGVNGSSQSLILPVPFGGTGITRDTFCGGETVLLTDLSRGAESVDWQIVPDANDQFTRRPQGTNLALDVSNDASGNFTAVQILTLDGRTYPGDTVKFTIIESANVANATLDYDGEFVTATVISPSGQSGIRYDFGDGTVIELVAT